MAQQGTSPWIYVGCGCLALVGITIATCVGVGFMGYQQVRDISENMADPVARADKAREVLGADELPPGYNAQFALSIPWIMDMVVISDQAPIEGELDSIDLHNLGDSALLYFEFPDFGEQRKELRRFLEGETDHPNINMEVDIDFDPEKVLSRGRFDLGDTELFYAVFSGDIRSDKGRREGLQSMFLLECPDEERFRLATWFRSYPETMTPEDAASEYADEPTLRQFMSHFAPCRNR